MHGMMMMCRCVHVYVFCAVLCAISYGRHVYHMTKSFSSWTFTKSAEALKKALVVRRGVVCGLDVDGVRVGEF